MEKVGTEKYKKTIQETKQNKTKQNETNKQTNKKRGGGQMHE